jgi:hypothetical protein
LTVSAPNLLSSNSLACDWVLVQFLNIKYHCSQHSSLPKLLTVVLLFPPNLSWFSAPIWRGPTSLFIATVTTDESCQTFIHTHPTASRPPRLGFHPPYGSSRKSTPPRIYPLEFTLLSAYLPGHTLCFMVLAGTNPLGIYPLGLTLRRDYPAQAYLPRLTSYHESTTSRYIMRLLNELRHSRSVSYYCSAYDFHLHKMLE